MKSQFALALWSRSGRRLAFWIGGTFALSALVGTLVHGQISDADKKKRDAFLKAREEMRTVGSPTPTASPGTAGKPKPAKKKGKGAKGPSPKPTADPKNDEADENTTPTATPRKAQPAASRPSLSPSPSRRSEPAEPADPQPAFTARPSPTATEPARFLPTPAPTAPPLPTAAISNAPADITIEKSGLEEAQGYEPPPPPPRRRGFWFFGRRESYRYLSNSIIEQIRRAPVQRARWKFVIVHNSGTRQGNAKAFDYYHKRVRRMQNGMAYHFVVGNGTSSGNGAIEIGDRWRRQINGGHVHSDYLNNISLGICLVGDFNRDRPTKAQMEATEELIKYLRERCGKVEGRPMGVRPHREMNPPRWATDCPGDAFPYGWFRRF